MPKAVEVRSLYFKYEDSDKYALEDINLEIKSGEKVAIVGENGAGKTTLIKHFNGLLKPTKGYVKIFGVDTKQTTVASLARKVGLVFQNPDHQFFAESVEKEIEFALRNFGFSDTEIKDIIDRMLKFFGLEKYRKSSPFTLSGGEKKRLAIASVLCYNPDIVVLDEPTVGQDIIQKRKLSLLLEKISEMNKTIVVVTHDIDFVAENFKRVIVMAQGRVIADGEVNEILTNKDILRKARLLPPQVTLCAWYLSDLGVSEKIIKLDELLEEILDLIKGARLC